MTSDTTPYYLRPDVGLRPLVNRWTAIEQLISPVQTAMNIKHAHLPLLRSYLTAPEQHWKAAHTPALIGGPWVAVPPERAGEVEQLSRATERRCEPQLRLADAVAELDRLLQREAIGGSMEPLYPRVPDLLRGRVELVYDLAHNASMRFIEPLLYRSRYYDPGLQSLVLRPVRADGLPFETMTPWLPQPGHVHIEVPFADPGVAALFAMRTRPHTLGQLGELLGAGRIDADLLAPLLTSEAPRVGQRYAGEGVRVRYFGHACLLIETAEVSVLTDPLLSYTYPGGPRRYTFEDLPERVDHVLLTHFHKDHICLETLLQLRSRVGSVIIPKTVGGALQDPSFALVLRQLGFTSIVELGPFETLEIAGGGITALPFMGEHADLDVTGKAAHLVRLAGNALLCAADTNNVEPRLYTHLRELIGDVDTLFLGMECVGAPMSSVYGGLQLRPLARKHDQSRRTTGSDCDRALGIVDSFGLARAYVYAMGQEPWLSHILPIQEERDQAGLHASDRFVAECQRRGIEAERLYGHKEVTLARRST